ncbi:hypothetical protein ASE86_04140 [Sphingomonas sp. Leaf33]|uniref:hypothetical protein n=1 Tax=Sphingomonas sp. Leaf33 TaxID=1736215 RepID=UPI000701A0B8|nr:hypothetical protein [Sphingomonas sp. Leaf33]KQN25437.1 hypothetical protein ASE86_04140 [Sphingomonas sp. Leaf33]
MPRVIDTNDAQALSLGDVIEALEANPFDPRDEDAFCAFGTNLKRLANDRGFLARIIADELATRCSGQATNGYGAQVVMLHAGRAFTIRANIWPEADHSLVRANGRGTFFYDVPHDHNVSFLTVGYAGPGYWSDYYDYAYDAVAGIPGEYAGLRFVERSCLSLGKVQLYRAHRDVHSQLPPDRLSVSLNIMEASPASAFCDQYMFDTAHGTVASIGNPSPHEPLFATAAALGDADSLEMLDRIATTHPSTRLRYAAIAARASAARDTAHRVEVLEAGCRNTDRTVRTLARARLAEVADLGAWFAGTAPMTNNNTLISNEIG